MSKSKNKGKNKDASQNAFNDLMNNYGVQTDKKGRTIRKDSDSPREAIMQRMAERELQYTQLTHNYVVINYKRYKYKEIHKWAFFWTMIAILLFVTVVFGIIAIKVAIAPTEEIVNRIPILLGAYTSFISTIIAIPLLIGKYLFNKTEEADMGKIIENMQNYDRKGQELFKGSFDNDYRNH